MLQLSFGMEYIHSQNLVHRDIKSGNVLLSKPTRNGEASLVKLEDFGFSKSISTDRSYHLSGPDWASEICRIWEDYNHRFRNSADDQQIIMTRCSNLSVSALQPRKSGGCDPIVDRKRNRRQRNKRFRWKERA